MRKKLLSLALALALCLGLAVPALAADASGLDAKTAAEYYRVLWEQIQAEGIREDKEGEGIAYANLVDMDADGIPELVIIGFRMDWTLDIGIWTIKNGSAVQTFRDYGTIGTKKGHVSFARKNGCIRLFYDYYWSYRAFDGRDLVLIDANGTYEKSDYVNSGDGSAASPEDVAYDKSWIVDSTPILKVEDSVTWDYDDNQPRAVNELLTALKTKATAANGAAAPAAGTYGQYTITGFAYFDPQYPYTVTFDAAKVERKTVQVRGEDPEGGYSSYGNRTAVVVTLRPDTVITVTGGDPHNLGVPVFSGHYDGGGKYTVGMQGAWDMIYGGAASDVMPDAMLYSAFYYMDLPSDGDEVDYYLQIDANAPTDNTDASGGFTDVKSGAYYEEAVKWAADKGITSGTGAAAFSPDQTCTVAQILTFLWRANGSPEPAGRNPFSDISSGDYYYKAAVWAAGKGLVSGSKFNPNTPCTRGMVVTYLWKLAGSPNTRSMDYKPFTLDDTYDGYTMTLSLPMAFTQNTVITLCEDYYDINESGDITEGHRLFSEPALLVTVPPGTPMHFGGQYGGNWLGIIGKTFYLDDSGVYHSDPYTSYEELYGLEHVIKDGEIWRTNVDEKSYCFTVGAASSAGFSDIPANAPYASAVAWAVEKGVTSGTSTTTFSPDSTCTRGQIVTFLHRAMVE